MQTKKELIDKVEELQTLLSEAREEIDALQEPSIDSYEEL